MQFGCNTATSIMKCGRKMSWHNTRLRMPRPAVLTTHAAPRLHLTYLSGSRDAKGSHPLPLHLIFCEYKTVDVCLRKG